MQDVADPAILARSPTIIPPLISFIAKNLSIVVVLLAKNDDDKGPLDRLVLVEPFPLYITYIIRNPLRPR